MKSSSSWLKVPSSCFSLFASFLHPKTRIKKNQLESLGYFVCFLCLGTDSLNMLQSSLFSLVTTDEYCTSDENYLFNKLQREDSRLIPGIFTFHVSFRILRFNLNISSGLLTLFADIVSWIITEETYFVLEKFEWIQQIEICIYYFCRR